MYGVCWTVHYIVRIVNGQFAENKFAAQQCGIAFLKHCLKDVYWPGNEIGNKSLGTLESPTDENGANIFFFDLDYEPSIKAEGP